MGARGLKVCPRKSAPYSSSTASITSSPNVPPVRATAKDAGRTGRGPAFAKAKPAVDCQVGRPDPRGGSPSRRAAAGSSDGDGKEGGQSQMIGAIAETRVARLGSEELCGARRSGRRGTH